MLPGQTIDKSAVKLPMDTIIMANKLITEVPGQLVLKKLGIKSDLDNPFGLRRCLLMFGQMLDKIDSAFRHSPNPQTLRCQDHAFTYYLRDIEDYQRDGVVLIKGLFAGYIDLVRDGIEVNMRSPGSGAAENLKLGESGRFFDDYCNWQRIDQFRDVIHLSPAAEVAAI